MPGSARGNDELESLAALGYKVRVRVINDARRVKLGPQGPFHLVNSAGREFYRSQVPCFVKIETLQDVQRHASFRIIVREYDVHQKIQAMLFTREVRKQTSLSAVIVPVTNQLAEYQDFRRSEGKTLIAVGHFYDRQMAEQQAVKLRRLYPNARVIADPRPSSAGMIRVTLDSGDFLGDFKDGVKLIQDAPGGLSRLEPLPTELSEWKIAKKTDRIMRGDFDLWINELGRLRVANELFIEDYLFGVAPQEMGGFAPDEALKAQAVAARTTALHRLYSGRYYYGRYDLTDTQSSTMLYVGVEGETDRTRRMVAATRGEVLLHDNNLIDAVFSQSCGGVTTDGRELWSGEGAPYLKSIFDRQTAIYAPNLKADSTARPWLQSRPDVFCNADQQGFPEYAKKNFRWTRTFSGEQLTKLINQYYQVGTVRDIRIINRSSSGRVQELEVIGEKYSRITKHHATIQNLLGQLPSTLFVLEKQKDSTGYLQHLTIEGGGCGHGAGLCQLGALMMAHRGYDYRSILRHYYSGVAIKKIY